MKWKKHGAGVTMPSRIGRYEPDQSITLSGNPANNHITFIYTMLSQARQQILHICGDDKLATLAQAMAIHNIRTAGQ
jgi:hypothetical protein